MALLARPTLDGLAAIKLRSTSGLTRVGPNETVRHTIGSGRGDVMLRRIMAVGLPTAIVCLVLIVSAHASPTTSISFPISSTATDCPDPVALSGSVHGVITTLENANGTSLVHTSFNRQGVAGVGLLSGRIY
jgi:hypothetical protein